MFQSLFFITGAVFFFALIIYCFLEKCLEHIQLIRFLLLQLMQWLQFPLVHPMVVWPLAHSFGQGNCERIRLCRLHLKKERKKIYYDFSLQKNTISPTFIDCWKIVEILKKHCCFDHTIQSRSRSTKYILQMTQSSFGLFFGTACYQFSCFQ